ncbi:hypothetical protein ACFY36_33910 [Actinoplanes sp. NPDC000266]
MRRIVMTLAVAGVALAAGCADRPRQVAGEAIPVGGSSSTPTPAPAPVVTTTSPSPSASATSATPSRTSARPGTSSSPPAKNSSPPKIKRVIGPVTVLGPTGLGKLQIGMTRAEAEATGLVVAGEGENGCGSWILDLPDSGGPTVGYSPLGVVSIPAYGKVATPEGIRITSSLDAVERAYPDLSGPATENGATLGDGPAYAGQQDKHGGVHYRFTFENGAVKTMKLQHDTPKC